jgi:hypothetical protein
MTMLAGLKRLNEDCILLLMQKKKERRLKAMHDIEYAVREHDVIDENQLPQATVMYTIYGKSGPWHDMVTGPADYCWEILDALQAVEDVRRREREEKMADDLIRARRTPPKTVNIDTTDTGAVLYYKS